MYQWYNESASSKNRRQDTLMDAPALAATAFCAGGGHEGAN